ncbi:hypothetical protein HanPSC8_Chr08g0328361 [Helianthus annuus]|nr:hypothetical protein HanPSC8_Chr08g0328361 [Helianthus annuus]
MYKKKKKKKEMLVIGPKGACHSKSGGHVHVMTELILMCACHFKRSLGTMKAGTLLAGGREWSWLLAGFIIRFFFILCSFGMSLILRYFNASAKLMVFE